MPGHWHYMMLELHPTDALVKPLIGQEQQPTRQQAQQLVQNLLDALAMSRPDIVELAKLWREGAKDDTVYHDRLIFTIFECTHPTCDATYQAVVEEWANHFRKAGTDVTIGKPSNS